jgi:hypothetical protein
MGLSGKPATRARQGGELPAIRGWLLVYLIALTALVLHGSALTIGSIVVYAHRSAAGSHSLVPLSSLMFYVITNVILILYAIYLFILMSRRRKSAIINNIVFNILSVAFLVSWHIIGEKSNIGTIVDSVPNLVGAAYFLLSKRVKNTFVIGPRLKPSLSGATHT